MPPPLAPIAPVDDAAASPALAEVAPEKTRNDLEWDRLLLALAARCETAMGRDLASDLRPAVEISEAERAVREVKEAIAAADRDEPLPITSLADVREAYDRAAHGGVLAAPELRLMIELLGAARTLRRFLHARRRDLPALFDACATDTSLDRVEDDLRGSFDLDGTLADHASPRLRELRGEYATSRGRVISRLEELMRRYESILQDGFWTEREGRYVLPVRADAHERFPGLVHASSGSGATLFVEPRVIIPLGNRLKMLEGEVRREEDAIYAKLTGQLVDVLSSVRGGIEAIARADLRNAACRLAHDMRLTFPDAPPPSNGASDEREPIGVGAPGAASPSGRSWDARHGVCGDPGVDAGAPWEGPPPAFVADLRALRHPLLVLEAMSRGDAEARSVVASDIRIAAGRALVVSGPNAGGKTVALKALGLSSLMLRSGLPVAAAEGSVLGFVDVVLTDVGDDQSLQKSLSTFSAHVTNLARILDAARPGALVLLDELAGGTDPREGEALAAAVLDGLCRRGAAVVATTHYEGLKALALADPRFQNASVGFDEATFMPTFRLALGVPGASSALSVARRFGVPSLVIERAQAYLSGEERTFEETVKALNAERRALELARAAAEAGTIENRLLRARLEAELNELRARDRRVVQHEAEALLASIRKAREEVRTAQVRLRAKTTDLATARASEKGIDAVAGRFAIGGDLEPLVQAASRDLRADQGERVGDETPLRKGAKVYVLRLRAEAEVVDIQADGQLRVAAGSLKLTVPRAEVRVLYAGPAADGVKGSAAGTSRGRGRAPRLQSSHGHSLREPTGRAVGGAKPTGAAAEVVTGESAARDVVVQTSDNTCDIRGMRVDDAWGMVEAFLDRLLNAGVHAAVIVHGHGSGALRDKIREELRRSRYVDRFRPGRPDEGGDGATIVWLA